MKSNFEIRMLNFSKKIIGLFLLVYVLASCNQNPYLATHLAPSSDNLNASQTDTFQIYAHTIYHDSVPTYNLGVLTLGELSNNALFGTMTSSIYAQFNLPENQFSFDATTTIDSVFITFPYLGTYGDTLSRMDLSITPIDAASANKINDDRVYYSNDNFAIKSSPLATMNNVLLKLKDSVMVYGKRQTPQLRIPITNAAFIQSLKIQDINGAYLNSTNFHNFFNGVYINVTSSNTNGIMQLNASDPSNSGLQIYYHTATADSLSVLFAANANGTVNHFSHNFSGSKVLQQINNSTGNDTVVYLSGLAGVHGKLYIPGLSNFKNVMINKATLTFYDVNPAYTGLFGPPTNLLLSRYDASTNLEYSLEDLSEGSPLYGVSSTVYFGGVRNTVDGSYTFNIARYLQKLVNGTYSNNGFFIEMNNAAESPYQVVIRGGNSFSKKIKLKIVYTKIR